ncbi:MAG TPA: filamentous hemagglutinin N-terminal domain-containing protein, partial [Gammaproteobacteria bacterium]
MGMRAATLLLTAGLVGTMFQAQANPQGGHVVAGKGNITTSTNGNLTLVHQKSSNLVINWSSFNIGKGQTVKFIQPGSSSAALNRIFDQDPTQIYGNLLSNGKVFLVNPNGIFFSKDSYVNTGALFASTLGIGDADFMSGNYDFSAPNGVDGGPVVNHGTLVAANGGSINLIGGSVYNDGVISATLGQVDLVAGHAVTVDFDGDGLMSFEVTQPVLHKMLDGSNGSAVTNAGTVEADGGTVVMTANVAQGVFAEAVNNSGVIEATGVVQNGSNVYLAGSGNGASGLNRGVGATGNSESTGTSVVGLVDHTGSVTLTGQGGNAINTGSIDVSAEQGNGGSVTLQSDYYSMLLSHGSIDASAANGLGGDVEILGHRVGLLDASSIDASGAFGGGTVLIGGDTHGGNGVQTASEAVLSNNSSIDADATVAGDGGKVVLWSNDYTGFYGSISIDGGAQGGNGGFTETSSHGELQAYGSVTMQGGQSGIWLLDPTDITIQNAASNNIGTTTAPGCLGGSETCFQATGTPSVLSRTTLNAALTGGATVIVYTAGSNGQNGNITVSSTVTAAGAGTLDLEATGGINIGAAITTNVTTTPLNVNLWADYSTSGPGATYVPSGLNGAIAAGSDVAISNTITTRGGSVDIETDKGAVTGTGVITATGVAGATATSGGTVTIGGSFSGNTFTPSATPPTSVALTTITTTGGASTGAAGAVGGNVGIATSAGAIGVTTITATGGASSGGAGGAGATVVLTASGGNITGTTFTANGGAPTAGNNAGGAGGTIDLTTLTSGNITPTNINANGGNGRATGAPGGGVGGTVAIVSVAGVGGTGISAIGGSGGTTQTGGKGGTVSVTGASGTLPGITVIGGAAGTTAPASGGNAGTINITNTGSTGLAFGTLTLNGINGNGAGNGSNGGTLNFTNDATSGTWTVPAFTITGGTATTGTAGIGGNFSYTANAAGGTLSFTAPTTTGGTASASGGVAGAGGAISVTDTAGSLVLTGALTTSGTAAAVAGVTGGAAGAINITDATGSLSLSGWTLVANGGGSTTGTAGLGGAVNINGNGASLTTTPTITANGGTASGAGTGGAGGTVTLASLGNMIVTNSVTANGGGTTGGTNGVGGTINVYSNTNAVNINNATLKALAGSAGTGSGTVVLGTSANGFVDEVGGITETGTGTITAGVLNVFSVGLSSANLSNVNTVTKISGVNADSGFTFDNGGTALNVSGIVNTTTHNGPITFIGDNITLNNNMSAGSGLVSFNTATLGDTICVGGSGCNLNLSTIGLNAINTTGGITIGLASNGTNTGGINFSGSAAVPFTGTTGGSISLVTGGTGAIITTNPADTLTPASGVNVLFQTTGTGSIQLPGMTLGGASTLTASSGGSITQAAIIAVNSTSSFNSATNNGSITLTNVGNAFTGAVSLASGTNSASLDDSIALNLGASSVGSLTVVETGTTVPTSSITQSGALTVSGTSSFDSSAGNGAISLTNTNNAFTGAVGFTTGTGNVNLDNSIALSLAASNIGGSLTVVETGTTAPTSTITQTGALTVTGASSFNTSAGNGGISLNNGSNALTGAVSLSTGTGGVNLDNSIALNLGASSVGASGLIVTETGTTVLTSSITQSGILNVGGNVSFNTSAGNGNVTLTNTSNTFTNSVVLSTGTGNASLDDSVNMTLGASNVGGNLALVETGANAMVFSTSVIAVGGTTSVDTSAGNGDITLVNVADSFTGAVSFITGTGSVSMDNKVATNLGASNVGGILNVLQTGTTAGTSAITQSGALIVGGASLFNSSAGNGDIILTNAGNSFSSSGVTLTTGTGNASLDDKISLTLSGSVGGNLNVVETGLTAANSNASSLALTVGGTSSFDTSAGNGSVLLANNSNFTGAISLNTGTGNAFINNNIATNLGTSNVGGSLTVLQAGTTVPTSSITQSGALTVGGTSSFDSSAGNGTITLTNTANAFTGAVSLSAGSGNVSIDNNKALVLDNISTTGNLVVVENNATAANAAITQAGGASISVGGTSSFDTSAGNGAITLANTTNAFTGAVSLASGTGNVSLDNDIALLLGNVTISGAGTLTVVENSTTAANAAITQAGGTSISVNGASSFDTSAGNGAVTLANAGNDFVTGAVSVNSGSGAIQLTDTNAIKLGTISTTGALTVIAGGNITQNTGGVSVGGLTSLTAGANSITLNDTINDFNTLTIVSASSATIDDANSLILAGISASGAVAINFGQGGTTSTLTLGNTALSAGSLAISGGSAVNDTIVGNDNGDTFTITGSNSGTISATGLPGTTTFSGVGNLTGGTGNDEFLFNGGSLAGSIDGVSGTDTLAYATGPISVVLTSNSSGTGSDIGGGFSNITTLIGSGNAGDTLTGANTTNSWNLTGADSGKVNGTFSYSGIANITGGTGDDTFTLAGGTVSGTLSGGGFATLGDTIVGTGSTSYYFDITNSDAGSVGTASGTPASLVHAFSGIQNLTGANGDDTFAFSTASSTLSGNINGGGGTNTVDYTGSAVTSVTLGAALPGAGSITSIQDLIGSGNGFTLIADGTGDEFTIDGGNSGNVEYAGLTLNLTFSNVGNLKGKTGGDSFDFTTG